MLLSPDVGEQWNRREENGSHETNLNRQVCFEDEAIVNLRGTAQKWVV